MTQNDHTNRFIVNGRCGHLLGKIIATGLFICSFCDTITQRKRCLNEGKNIHNCKLQSRSWQNEKIHHENGGKFAKIGLRSECAIYKFGKECDQYHSKL